MERAESEGQENKEQIRLNRFLAQCGLGARRKCEELIASGHILINGERVKELGTKVRPGVDKVEYDGKIVKPINKLEYLAYFKPRQVMVTADDPEGRETIYSALQQKGRDIRHLRHVGRLDYLSEGLLLLTNDGDLIHALTHPRFQIKKVYQVRTSRKLSNEDIKRMLDGIESEDQILHAAEVTELPSDKDQCWYEIVLFEGKNRQIRRMLDCIGHEVRRLRRVQFGSVRLGTLETGSVRELTEREIGAMKNTGYKSTDRRKK